MGMFFAKCKSQGPGEQCAINKRGNFNIKLTHSCREVVNILSKDQVKIRDRVGSGHVGAKYFTQKEVDLVSNERHNWDLREQ